MTSVTSQELEIISGESIAVSVASDHVSVIKFIGYSVMASFTGTPTGTLKIQLSNDEMGVSAADSVWVDLTASSTAITDTTPVMINVQNGFYTKIRVVYTVSAGSGTLTVRFTGKAA